MHNAKRMAISGFGSGNHRPFSLDFSSTMSLSCPLPETIYTAFYCEENVYLLCEALSMYEEVAAVIVSNRTKTVALWNQKLSRDTQPVIWDYHVVLLLRSGDHQYWIYDFDTRLPFPCLLKDYLQHTFQDVPSAYRSLFRIVPGTTYIENFASDRSHMVNCLDPCSIHVRMYSMVPDSSLKLAGPTKLFSDDPMQSLYRSPPPLYPPLRGKKATVANNLMRSFVEIVSSEETFGDVKDLSEMFRLGEA
ncbi:N-terminal glutamine amidase-domain-containing protein [Mycena maculata]|uniref:Protein N-terminal glutamine amidohydrolase n=1 Tax=Mycena maculata TaxID=230809 RepID=A0AAD7IA71_9AGAR|nr:N-terminal glutamine amidase-domain-containing protein [Mycena maculata]